MGKSMHRRLAAVMGLAIAVGAAGWALAAGGADSYVLDPAHTSAAFKIEHLGISWVSGRFNDVSGKCAIDKADPAQCTFEVTIKPASIDTNNAKRNEHLCSKDFFSVKEFPEMTFKSTSVKKAAADDADAVYEVTGDFTMHGVTKPVTFTLRGGKEAEFPKGSQRIGFFTEFTIKRSDYGMDKMPTAVGDVVKIAVSFEAVKK
jgi:polyisoprenoid-binding protein YceI